MKNIGVKKMKLENVRSFAEISQSEELQWLWVEGGYGAALNGAELPSLKALCLPKDAFEQVDGLPELPELMWLWIKTYDHYNDEGEMLDFEWFRQRFPKLECIVERYSPFPAGKIARHLMRQGEIAYLPHSGRKRRTDIKEYSLSIEKLRITPKPINLHQ